MRTWLDRVTGRVTMYRLVTILLGVLAVVALVLSLAGQLPYEPLELLASAATAMSSTLLANGLFAFLFRRPPHTESSIITGFLLFFLFWPSAVPAELATLGLAGVLATASKYLIVWRGRHIFNPAAAGAALVAVLQLNSAVWWIGTGTLLPFTLIGAFLVLYRTRRLPMGAVFVAVSGVILTVRLATAGVGDALATTFLSYPVVFFAGFMLSEPLTLPPRRWQQLSLAALVGVVFTIPFNFGPVFLSFEFALLIGNLFAFALGQRRGIRFEYLGKRQLTPTAWEFDLAPKSPVSFRAGQYLELTVPHAGGDARGSRRTFSIASAPSPSGPITLAMRMPDKSSSFKRAILELTPGARVDATSVGGDFLLPSDTTKPVLLIAGGIGITPFLSQLAHDEATGVSRDVILVYVVSSVEELAFTDRLGEQRVLLLSPGPPAELPAAWRWIGAGPVAAELLASEVPDIAARAAYVSGAPAMVTAARAALRRAGTRRVATDYFTGY